MSSMHPSTKASNGTSGLLLPQEENKEDSFIAASHIDLALSFVIPLPVGHDAVVLRIAVEYWDLYIRTLLQ
jgi:hypothetical protein